MMPTQPDSGGTVRDTVNPPGPAASRVVRRVHMYLGLFLAPWMFMYAVSTLVMNHREFVQRLYPSPTPRMVVERELEYQRAFGAEVTPEQKGVQILEDVGLTGTHRVSGGKNGSPLVIDRQHAVAPRRITWIADTEKLVIERQEFRGPTFLERLHRRRGYQQPYVLEDTWAFSVDVAVVAMVFWCVSGLWLWWELRPVRFWGGLCTGLGLILFAVFLALL